MNRERWLPIAFACLAHACAGGTPPEDGSVRLGTGQREFETIPLEGGTVELVFGPQGGFHVWGRAWFEGLAPDVDVSFNVRRIADGAALHASMPLRRRFENGISSGLVPDGSGYATGPELVVLTIRCAEEVVGSTLEFETVVHDRTTGQTVSARRNVSIVDHDPSPDCTSPGP